MALYGVAVWTFVGVVAVPEFFDQYTTPAGDPRFDRTDRQIESGRDFGIVEIADIAHDDSCPKFFGQLGKRLVDRYAIDDAIDMAVSEIVDRLVGRTKVVVVDDVELWLSLSFAQFVECSVGCDPIHPGSESGTAVEAVQVANDPNHGLLGGVVGVTGAAGDATAHGVNTAVVSPEQLVHRCRVTTLSGCNKIAVGPIDRGHGW
jgi:hypothetical protein